MSINLELPTAQSLRELAPHKNRKNILKPLRQIQLRREHTKDYLGLPGGKQSLAQFIPDYHSSNGTQLVRKVWSANAVVPDPQIQEILTSETRLSPYWNNPIMDRKYVPAGQSTQMIIGATRKRTIR